MLYGPVCDLGWQLSLFGQCCCAKDFFLIDVVKIYNMDDLDLGRFGQSTVQQSDDQIRLLLFHPKSDYDTD